MASYNMHDALQNIYESNPSAESLMLSDEQFKELMQLALQDEKRWRLQLGSSVKLLSYSAMVLFGLGIIQIVLTCYIYRHNSAVPSEPGDAN
jgi:hypothetical protein